MAVRYMVPGLKVVYSQPDTMACWATVFAMMKAWKARRRFANIRAAVSPLGQPWLGYFDRNTGIPPSDGLRFETATGLVREPRMNLSVKGWEQLLQQKGLLWVSGTVPGGIHDRILEGINGDESAEGTEMLIMDPDGGRQYSQILSDFLVGFEGQAAVEPFESDYQILHF